MFRSALEELVTHKNACDLLSESEKVRIFETAVFLASEEYCANSKHAKTAHTRASPPCHSRSSQPQLTNFQMLRQAMPVCLCKSVVQQFIVFSVMLLNDKFVHQFYVNPVCTLLQARVLLSSKFRVLPSAEEYRGQEHPPGSLLFAKPPISCLPQPFQDNPGEKFPRVNSRVITR
ncbi:unnamed protein product [Soboliphyme baturini]|uniref:RGS domain-containing protein n=1 Tax=Soboliphyme baturini TaxID=241478 RepID=A0A183J0G2_9BILA|nr:unnamed protein product [Soboliphyme baturini]